MKRVLVLLTLLVTMTLALSAGKAPRTPSATITVSCSVCTNGQPMTITGSTFAARTTVSLHISGPNTVNMSATADSRGNFSVYFPAGFNLASGYYTVTASQSGGASATTGFDLQ